MSRELPVIDGVGDVEIGADMLDDRIDLVWGSCPHPFAWIGGGDFEAARRLWLRLRFLEASRRVRSHA
jgi:hypothetical protein